jgi:hypothetical protein
MGSRPLPRHPQVHPASEFKYSESTGYADYSDMRHSRLLNTASNPRSAFRKALAGILSCLALCLGTGCVHRGRDSVVHFWADYNTLEECAFFVDKIHHQNLKSFTVDRFRWMYGLPPGGPLPEEAPFVTGVPVIQQGPYPSTLPAFETEPAPPGLVLPPEPAPPADAVPADPTDSRTRNYNAFEGPTARGARSAEFASLERRRPAANATRPSSSNPSNAPAAPAIPPPKGSWLFARP